ncbi:hypothetical protein KBB96_08000 [Luteolibacter ambystomatis]|uniref:Uncharacterized protein n=1 Tax=Luteolibacter ambystomatis TaxID=2824561 RepID=A0A975PGQ8_9BACT|nr:YdjY domain-containing protein [Luteolibacter ambystomatis]QUE52825.1 hypothetical protein KBB96_08000 [Luteolibacter ambystomatis]
MPSRPTDQDKQAQPPADKETAARQIEKTGETTFKVGLVQGDRATRTVVIPAKIKLREGLIEYALVTTKGKVHETLFTTEASPLHIQTAALLLGLSPQPGKGPPVPVTIEVEWAGNGPKRQVPLEEMVELTKDSPQAKSGTTLPKGAWSFQASTLDEDGFGAERDGSVIALISDPVALVGNPRADQDDDDLHIPHAASLPPEGLPVSIRISPAAPAKAE